MQIRIPTETRYDPDLPFRDFPILTDDRLVLRKPAAGDTEQLMSLYGNKEVVTVFGMNPFTDIREVKLMLSRWERDYKSGEGLRWAMTSKESDQLMGVMAFRKFFRERHSAEVGYSILPEYRRQGITLSSLHLAINYAFGPMGLSSLEALTISDNFPSQQLLRNAGFVQENFLRHHHFFNGRFIDMYLFCLQREGNE